jgi:hypothetical protein
VILAVGDGVGVCPDCGKPSERRHGWHERHLQDLPAQGAAVTVKRRDWPNLAEGGKQPYFSSARRMARLFAVAPKKRSLMP